MSVTDSRRGNLTFPQVDKWLRSMDRTHLAAYAPGLSHEGTPNPQPVVRGNADRDR